MVKWYGSPWWVLDAPSVHHYYPSLSFLYGAPVPQLECARVGKLILVHANQTGSTVFKMNPKLNLEGQCPGPAIYASAKIQNSLR